MMFLIFFLIFVEEDRDIPIVLPDYTDSLPVLMPVHSTKNVFGLGYGYPDLFYSYFENGDSRLGVKRGQDIDKYLKWWGETTFNTRHFNLFFSLSCKRKEGAFLIKHLLDLNMKWKFINVDMRSFLYMFAYYDTLPNGFEGYGPELWTMSDGSLGFSKNGFLVKIFRENIYEGKKGIIIQYANQDRGIRIRMSDKYTGVLGYFSPLFYVKGGRDNIVNIDSVSYIPFIYHEKHWVIQDYAEFGFLFSKIRLSKFYSTWFFDYDTEKNVFITKFYNEPMWTVSFSLDKEKDRLNFFLGIKDKIEMEGIKFKITKTFNIFQFQIKGYGGYFRDYGYYGTGGIAIKLKKRISPLIEIDNINYGKILAYSFLSSRIYVGLEYESIQ